MKTLFASLFAALLALATFATHAAVQPKDGIVVADEEKTDGDKAPTTDTEKKDAATSQSGASAGANTAPVSDEEKTDGDKAPTTDTEKKDDEDKDKDSRKSD